MILFTINDIIAELGVTRNRVTYSIKQLGLEPRARHGRTLMYSRADMDRIRRDIVKRNPPPKGT